jgi:hypothetical protein
MLTLCGCRQSDFVSYNVSKEADNFNVVRKLTVLNARTDTILLELIGTFSISNNTTNELQIVCEVADGEYQKHYVYLNDYTLYVVEDISGSDVSKYHYEITFLPQTLQLLEWELGDKGVNHGD